MDGWEDGWKVVGRVVGGRWEGGGKMVGGWNGGCWEDSGKVMGGWWEDGGRVVGGWWEGRGRVLVGVGFLSSCNGDLRDRLVLPQRSQVSFRVARGVSGFLSSHCRVS